MIIVIALFVDDIYYLQYGSSDNVALSLSRSLYVPAVAAKNVWYVCRWSRLPLLLLLLLLLTLTLTYCTICT